MALAVDIGIERRQRDAELGGDITGAVFPVRHHRHRGLKLRTGHHPRPSAGATPGSRGGQTCHRALMDEIALELGERGENAKDKSPRRRGRVDVTGQHLQPDPLLLKLADKPDDMRQGSSDPVEFPDDKRVALASGVECLGKAGPLGGAARTDILVDLPTASLFERIALKVEALLGRRHPHISDQHGDVRPLRLST